MRRSIVGTMGYVSAHRFPDIGADTVDVDVELVLASRHGGVDCETHPVARDVRPGPRVDETACVPSCREVIRGIRLEKGRTLDAGDPFARDE